MAALGKYELHEQLGRGGFGTVYRAVDAALQREVALKVLHPQLTTDPDFLERFRKEARLVASLKSPHIVTIYDLEEFEGRVFIAMEYLPGGSLQQRLEKSGPVPFDDALCLIRQVAHGLRTAHKKGLVHRDIKPANILFDDEGSAVIGDFGLARALQNSTSSSSSSGGAVGTPAYRAPELWLGKPPAGAAADIYSLACVLSEMLSGKVLFDGPSTDVVITQHLVTGPSMPESFPEGVPAGIRPFLEKALAKDPLERYQSVEEFEQALIGLSAASPRPREQRGEEPPRTGLETPAVSPPGPTPPPEAPAQPESEEPETAEGVKPPEGWPWKRIGILAGVIAALGLGIWLVLNPGKETNSQTTSATPEPTPVINSRVSEVDGMEMVYVPAGDFLMGSPEGVGQKNEYPQRAVHLDAFWIDKTEVTNAMYEQCVTAGACTQQNDYSSNTRESYYGNPAYADYPVIANWPQAYKYCAWVGRSLPGEAQWEKAARGTDGYTYPWGDDAPNSNLANYGNNTGDTTKVGSYPAGASPYGALDMAGNVWEWTADWFDVYPGGDAQAGDSLGSSSRVLRGGSWLGNNGIRTAYRSWLNPSYSTDDYGFRCALPLP